MRTLVLGSTGTIGSAILNAASERNWPALGTCYRRAHRLCPAVDLRDADALNELIADYQPDATVCGAPIDTAADAGRLAAMVRTHGGVLVAFTSEAVYGDCKVAMREDDPLTPATDRGRHDAAVEAAIRAELPERSLILRTSGVFDGGRFGRVSRVLHRLKKGEVVRADNERFSLPTFATDLAEVTLDLLTHGHAGTFNAVGPDRHTEFTFARLVAHLFGYDADLIQPTKCEARPPRVMLDRFRLRVLLGANAFRPTGDALRGVRSAMGETHRMKVAA
jgi:dTDP-4-dehydrorhamnose reductase